MPKHNTKKSRSRQMSSRFTLAQLQVIDYLADQPAPVSLGALVGQLINKSHGSQPLGDLRSIIVNASNGNKTLTEIMEVTE